MFDRVTRELNGGQPITKRSEWGEGLLAQALAEEAHAYDPWFLKAIFEADRTVDGKPARAVCLDHSDVDFELMLSRAQFFP